MLTSVSVLRQAQRSDSIRKRHIVIIDSSMKHPPSLVGQFSPMVPGMNSDDVVLAAYPAKRCPIRVHWDTHSQFRLEEEPDAVLQRQFAIGLRFEAAVFEELVRRIAGDVTDLRAVDGTDSPAQTVAAMDAHALVIVAGTLPTVNGRSGRPDLLVRVDHPDGTAAGYVPVDVKAHRHLGAEGETEKGALFSPLHRPAPRRATAHPTFRERAAGGRFSDVMQLAHYTRMLQELGYHPGDEWLLGGVIGNSRIQMGHDQEDALVIAWHRLDEAKHKSFSRSAAPKAKLRTALERYDHEFEFRRQVAARPDPSREPGTSLAQLQADLAIEPFRIAECDTCRYATAYCGPAMADHASADILLGQLGVRTWGSLSRYGVRTTTELASLDVNAFLCEAADESWNVDYTDTEREGRKLLDARSRARLIVENKLWQWKEHLEIPSATVEIDVDFEYDSATGACYLITARRREEQDDSTRLIKVWDDFDAATQDRGDALVGEFLSWAAEEVTRAEGRGDDGDEAIRFYHWKGPERWMVKRVAERSAHLADAWKAYQPHLEDMGSSFEKALFSVRGTSVKIVGPAYGFSWTDHDAGGGSSLTKLDEARSEDPSVREAARAWLVKYNEDDVDVMARIRDEVAARPNHVPDYRSMAGLTPAEDS